MFQFFRKRLTPAQIIEKDIQTTLTRTFDALAREARKPEGIQRLYSANGQLAAMIGALRDNYPTLPVDDDGPGLSMIKLIGARDVFQADVLLSSIFELVRHCPNNVTAKMNTMIFLVSPSSIPLEDRPTEGLLGKWSKIQS